MTRLASADLPALPVYLIHYRQPEWCASSVRSILSSRIPVAVTVVDNSPNEWPSLRDRLRHDDVRVIDAAENVGYTGGANIALADWWNGAEELVVIGSHDLHVHPDTLNRLRDAALASPDFGILGPVLEDKVIGASSRAALNGATSDPTDNRPVPVEWLSGTCLMIRRACVGDIGGFDRTYHSYVEDFDFCKRAEKAGWQVGICRDASAWGLGSGDRTQSSVQGRPNLIRAHRLHYGARAALVTFLTQLMNFVRNLVGAAAWWRPGDQRRASSRSAVSFIRGLRLLKRVWAPEDVQLDASSDGSPQS